MGPRCGAEIGHLFRAIVCIPTVRFGPGNELLSDNPDRGVATAGLLTEAPVYRRVFGLPFAGDDL